MFRWGIVSPHSLKKLWWMTKYFLIYRDVLWALVAHISKTDIAQNLKIVYESSRLGLSSCKRHMILPSLFDWCVYLYVVKPLQQYSSKLCEKSSGKTGRGRGVATSIIFYGFSLCSCYSTRSPPIGGEAKRCGTRIRPKTA